MNHAAPGAWLLLKSHSRGPRTAPAQHNCVDGHAREMGGAVMKAMSSMSSRSRVPTQLRSKKRATKPSVSPLPAG